MWPAPAIRRPSSSKHIRASWMTRMLVHFERSRAARNTPDDFMADRKEPTASSSSASNSSDLGRDTGPLGRLLLEGDHGIGLVGLFPQYVELA